MSEVELSQLKNTRTAPSTSGAIESPSFSGYAESAFRQLLAHADVVPGRGRPWDPVIHDQCFYRRVLAEGSLGFGESYVDGWWDCESLVELVARILSADLQEQVRNRWSMVAAALVARATNLQSPGRAFQIADAHYDIGNDLYRAMLDEKMIYTCAYWKDAATLDEAQEAKLDLVCRKIGMRPGQRVLDIGCGWGGFARFAAERYGAEVVGITVSKEQAKMASENCSGLPVEIRLVDYRSVNGRFDHIVSLGMLEHVGYKNYRTYMEVARRCLADDGLFLIQVIGSNRSRVRTDPWLEKYIFPNSLLPSIRQLSEAMEGLFVIEDLHNFGADYEKTLLAWHSNFESAWPALRERYGERFRRMWCYYLLSCAGTFRARYNQLWQLVLSKKGVRGGYKVVR